MNQAVRLGLIGCGRVVQRVHLPNLLRLRNARLTALADSDAQARDRARRQAPAAATHERAEALLDSNDVDAVLIAAPPAIHAPLAIQALEAGKHVYVEKPLALDPGEAQRVLDAAHRHPDPRAMLGFNYRLDPRVRQVRHRLRAGEIGRLIAIRSVFTTAARTLPPWKRQRATGGGVLLDLASHHIDLIAHLLDEPVHQVSAVTRAVAHEQDTAALTLTMPSGVSAQVSVSLAGSETDRIEFIGDAGRLIVDRFEHARVLRYPQKPPRTRGERGARAAGALAGALPRAIELVRRPGEGSHRAALQAFVDAIRTDQPAPVPLEAGLHAARVIAAAERAADTGQTIEVALESTNNDNDAAAPTEATEKREITNQKPETQNPKPHTRNPEPANPPDLSIIVPVHNAAPYLHRCINALLAQVDPPGEVEIVMVENNSTDDSAAIIGRYPQVRLVSETKPGAYAARNRGVAEASGSILVFIDPDCVARPDWLGELTAPLLRDDTVQWVQGDAPPAGASRAMAMLAAFKQEKERYIYTSDDPMVYIAHTNNAAVRRPAFDRFGPFTELKRGGDVLLVRAIVDGLGVEAARFAPRAVVEHLEVDRVRMYYRKMNTYAASFNRYTHYRPCRPLSREERWRLYRRTAARHGYGLLDTTRLLMLLVGGAACWWAGARRATQAETPATSASEQPPRSAVSQETV